MLDAVALVALAGLLVFSFEELSFEVLSLAALFVELSLAVLSLVVLSLAAVLVPVDVPVAPLFEDEAWFLLSVAAGFLATLLLGEFCCDLFAPLSFLETSFFGE